MSRMTQGLPCSYDSWRAASSFQDLSTSAHHPEDEPPTRIRAREVGYGPARERRAYAAQYLLSTDVRRRSFHAPASAGLPKTRDASVLRQEKRPVSAAWNARRLAAVAGGSSGITEIKVACRAGAPEDHIGIALSAFRQGILRSSTSRREKPLTTAAMHWRPRLLVRVS